MRRIAAAILYLAAFIASAHVVTPAAAQATRTWVSGVGDDANPCSRTAPCKTFAGAISKTAAGGEINCIDPGGFGAVTIVKAMTIDCANVEAGVVVAGTNGVIVNAGASDVVVLRGIDFMGTVSVPGLNGIRFIAGGALHVEKCLIREFTSGAPNGNGILFQPSGSSKLFVSDTIVTNNGTSATTGGIVVQPTGTGSALFVITTSRINGNSSGIRADGTGTTSTIRGTISTSSISGNSNDGVTAIANTPGGSIIVMNKSVVSNNALTGLVANNAIFQFGESVVAANGVGVSSSNGAFLQTYQNNMLHANGNDNVGVLQILTLQ